MRNHVRATTVVGVLTALLGVFGVGCSPDSPITPPTGGTGGAAGMGGDGGTGGTAGQGGGSTTCSDGETKSCYSGPPGTENIGQCKSGTTSCSGGVWGACTGDVLPGTETCNNVDEDCNGKVDDGFSQPNLWARRLSGHGRRVFGRSGSRVHTDGSQSGNV